MLNLPELFPDFEEVLVRVPGYKSWIRDLNEPRNSAST